MGLTMHPAQKTSRPDQPRRVIDPAQYAALASRQKAFLSFAERPAGGNVLE